MLFNSPVFCFLLIQTILHSTEQSKTHTGFKTSNSLILSNLGNLMDDSKFPKEYFSQIDLGSHNEGGPYYVTLYKSNPSQSKLTLEVVSNPSCGYCWYSVGIYEKNSFPSEPYVDNLKNIINRDFVIKKIEEGSSLNGLVVSPFNYNSPATGLVGSSGVSKATITTTSDVNSGDYLVLISYARSFSPLNDCYFKKIFVRII